MKNIKENTNLKKICEKIKKILLDKKLYIFLAITILFFVGFVKVGYTRCTYRMYYYDWHTEFNHYIGIGRVVTALLWGLVSILNTSLPIVYYCSFFLAIMSVTLAMYLLYGIVVKLVKNKKIAFFATVMMIINSYIIDYMVYLEKGVMSFSVLATVIGIWFLNRFFETKDKKNLIFSVLSLVVCDISYQASSGLFVAFALILILKNSTKIKDFLLNNVLVALMYGIPLGLDFLIVKLTFTTARNEGGIDLIESTRKIISHLDELFLKSFRTMPKFVFLAAFAVVILTFIAALVSKKTLKAEILKDVKWNKNLKLILGFVYVIIGTLFVAIFPIYSLSTDNVALTPRATYVFASILGLMITYMFMVMDLRSKHRKVIYVLAGAYLAIQLVMMTIITQDAYIVNELDRESAYQVGQAVKAYEEETGIKIEYVAYYYDKQLLNSYPGIYNYNEMNRKMISFIYRNLSLVGFYTGVEMERNDDMIKEEYSKMFLEKDWDYFDNDQLIFEGNVLHWCMF